MNSVEKWQVKSMMIAALLKTTSRRELPCFDIIIPFHRALTGDVYRSHWLTLEALKSWVRDHVN